MYNDVESRNFCSSHLLPSNYSCLMHRYRRCSNDKGISACSIEDPTLPRDLKSKRHWLIAAAS